MTMPGTGSTVTLFLMTIGMLLSSASADEVLLLNARIDKDSFILGEPVFVECCLSNASPNEVVVPFYRHDGMNSFAFEVKGPHGKPIAAARQERESFPLPHILSPGECIQQRFNLLECFSMSEVGEYRITLVFSSDGRAFRPRLAKKDSKHGQYEMEVVEGWKGKLRCDLGAVQLQNPSSAEDKQAFEYLRSGEDGFSGHDLIGDQGRRRVLIDQHPRATYTQYALLLEVDIALDRFHKTENRQFAENAMRSLKKIRSNNFKRGKIFNDDLTRQEENMKREGQGVDERAKGR